MSRVPAYPLSVWGVAKTSALRVELRLASAPPTYGPSSWLGAVFVQSIEMVGLRPATTSWSSPDEVQPLPQMNSFAPSPSRSPVPSALTPWFCELIWKSTGRVLFDASYRYATTSPHWPSPTSSSVFPSASISATRTSSMSNRATSQMGDFATASNPRTAPETMPAISSTPFPSMSPVSTGLPNPAAYTHSSDCVAPSRTYPPDVTISSAASPSTLPTASV